MNIKLYGKLDADPALYDAVIAYATEQGCNELVIAAHQRIPVGARHCRKPRSLTYDFIMDSGIPQAARQEASGKILCPIRK